jgi:hypothetical protein
MPDHDYLPRADCDLLLWHDHLVDALRTTGASLGVPASELAQLIAANQTLHAHVAAVADTAAKAAAAVADKEAYREKLAGECRALVRRLKVHANYTPGLGQSLGIVSGRPALDTATLQPRLELTADPGHVVTIAYPKAGTDGINVYGRRTGEDTWTLLGRSTRSPYIDRRAPRQPGVREEREYKAVYMLDDEEVGQASNIATITTRE